MEKLYPIISRGANLKAKKLGPNQAEIVSTPKAGVKEKPNQCENRLGMFESLAKLFTEKFAEIEHPECFHRGEGKCRYVITWEIGRSLLWRRVRNYFIIVSFLGLLCTFFAFPIGRWPIFFLVFFSMTLSLSFLSDYFEKGELKKRPSMPRETQRVITLIH